MKARKASFPPDTLLKEYMNDTYVDCYALDFATDRTITPDEIILSFLTKQPA